MDDCNSKDDDQREPQSVTDPDWSNREIKISKGFQFDQATVLTLSV